MTGSKRGLEKMIMFFFVTISVAAPWKIKLGRYFYTTYALRVRMTACSCAERAVRGISQRMESAIDSLALFDGRAVGDTEALIHSKTRENASGIDDMKTRATIRRGVSNRGRDFFTQNISSEGLPNIV